MQELILLCIVMVVPTVLALLAIEYCAGSSSKCSSAEYLLTTAGYVWKGLASPDRAHRASEHDHAPAPAVDDTVPELVTGEAASSALRGRPGVVRHAS